MTAHLSFDGIDDVISITNPFDIGASDFTVSLRAKSAFPQTLNEVYGFFAKSNGAFGSDASGIELNIQNVGVGLYNLEFARANGSGFATRISHSMAGFESVSFHVAVTYIFNGDAVLYLNGEEVQRQAYTGSYTDTFDFLAFKSLSTFGAGGPFWFGFGDDVRVYTRSLSALEVAELARYADVDDTNIKIHWKLDDGSGSTASDSSGNGNNGTITGSTWVNGNMEISKIAMTVYEHAGEVALGDPIQYTAAVIDGVASAAIVGEGNKRRRVRLFSNVDAWVKWGENPTATGGSDSMPLSFNNPQYVDIESGHTLHAISR